MKNAKKVVTFGEIMMRLNPKGNERFLQAESFEVSYAGAKPTWRCLSSIMA